MKELKRYFPQYCFVLRLLAISLFGTFVTSNVKAQTDTTPPQLVSLSFSSSSVDVTGGTARITVTSQWIDDLSGVGYGWISLQSPSGRQTISGSLIRTSGSAQNGVHPGS